MKTYQVKKISKPTSEQLPWTLATELNDFVYPWEKETPPETQFRALHDGEIFYFRFDATDSNIHTFQVNNDKKEVGFSDRVEIFLAKDSKLSSYYCLEMDSTSRVMDFEASYHRKQYFDWSWPEPLNLKTCADEKGYVVEGQISLKLLQEMSLLKGDTLLIGLYRANCTALADNEDSIKWISWVDPKTPQPDFHIPETFGQFVLLD